MTLSAFNLFPDVGTWNMPNMLYHTFCFEFAKLWFYIQESDLFDIPIPEYNGATSVHVKPKKKVPLDAPEPLGKPSVTLSWADAHLRYCLLTGRSVASILHLLNYTPVLMNMELQYLCGTYRAL